MESQGVITDLVLQPKFILQTSFKLPGYGTIREIKYTPDFRYTVASTGLDTVEDTKGFITTDYVIRKKLFLFHYVRNANLAFHEVTTAGDVRPFEAV